MFQLDLTEKKPYLDKSLKKKFTSLIFLFFLSVAIYCQEKTIITIEKADFFEKNEKKFPGASILSKGGNSRVTISHDGAILKCDEAFFYEKKNFIEAYGNVSLNQGDTLSLNSNYLEYNGDNKLAFAKGDVVLNEIESKLFTQSLFFDRNLQQAYYNKNGLMIRNGVDSIKSKTGTYFANKKRYDFKINVNLKSPKYIIDSEELNYLVEDGKSFFYGPTYIKTNESHIYCEIGFYNTARDIGHFIKNSKIDFEEYTIYGDSIFFNKNDNYASAVNNIKIIDTINNTITTGHQAEIFRDIDSMYVKQDALVAYHTKTDTTYVHGEIISIVGKEGEQIMNAFYNGKILSGNLSGKCDSIYFDQSSGIAKLLNLDKKQEKNLRTIKKPILWNNNSQITGDSIYFKFDLKDNTIDSLFVFNNVFIIEKDSLELGFNQIKGKNLMGNFVDSKLKEVDIIKNAESIYFLRNSENELIGIDKSKSAKIKILLDEQSIESFTKINQIDGKVYPEEKFDTNQRILKGFYFREDEIIKEISDLFRDDKKFKKIIIKQLKN